MIGRWAPTSRMSGRAVVGRRWRRRIGSARAGFERALQLGESAEALDGLGEAVHWLGEYERAIELKERAFVAYRRAGRALEASAQARVLVFRLLPQPGGFEGGRNAAV
jgi:tetratricopeptide (TPR) repeat protein